MDRKSLVALTTSAAVAFFTVLQDPVLLFLFIIAMQVTFFPAVKWLTLLFALLFVGFMYGEHDLVLSTIPSFFVRTDDALQKTNAVIAGFVALKQVFKLTMMIMAFDTIGTVQILRELLLAFVLFAVKYGIENDSDSYALQNVLSTIDYLSISIQGIWSAIASSL